jgi:HEAT repeat protein
MVDSLDHSVGRAWHRAGKTLGLSGPGVLLGLQLEGAIGPFSVRVTVEGDKTKIVTRDERPSALADVAWQTAFYPGVGASLTTGDPHFDALVEVRGDPVVAAAFLGASMRRFILRAAAYPARFDHGVLDLQLPEVPQRTTSLVSAVRATVALARRMTAPRNLAARLTSNALRDPVPAVRLNCLERLRESFPGGARPVLRAAMRDPDGAVRLQAAIALGAEGRTALLGLAKDARLDEAIQARAIATLDRVPVQELSRILATAMKRSRRAVALAVVTALGDSGTGSAVASLAPLVGAADPEIRLSAIRALGATDQPAAQGALIEALDSDASGAREAAARALGELGTVTSVAPLRAAVDAHPLDLGLRRIARRAIEAIQARAAGAAPGQLSVTDDAGAGGLSLVASAAGQLTLEGAGAPDEPTTRPAPRARRSRMTGPAKP